jgi:putative membrane protein
MFYMHGIGWGWWLVMSIGIVAFWGLVIYAIILLIRSPSHEGAEQSGESPEQVLKRRLAQGELSIDEYRQLQATLHEAPPDRAAALITADRMPAGWPRRAPPERPC